MFILAAVDDMLFSSKIRTTAKQLGIAVVFARAPQEILSRARELKPSLVIFDLNSQRTDPIATLGALKAEAALEGTRTIGFASHVDTQVIAAARAAGADQVWPRSAFAANLAEILLSARPAASTDDAAGTIPGADR